MDLWLLYQIVQNVIQIYVEDGVLFVCQNCAHEWAKKQPAENDGAKVVKMRTETFFQRWRMPVTGYLKI